LNLYAMVGNNPIRWLDFLGLASVPNPGGFDFDECDEDPCGKFKTWLGKLARHVKGRYDDMILDKNNLHKYDRKAYNNHVEQYKSQQRRLNKRIDEFLDKCKDPLPLYVYENVLRPAPSPPGFNYDETELDDYDTDPVFNLDNVLDWEYWEETTGLTGVALVTYLIISEGTRLYPPRNLVPVP